MLAVWVRAVPDGKKPVVVRVDGEYFVSDIIKDAAAMENLTSRISYLSLYPCDSVNQAIPDDVKASDLLNDNKNSMKVPFLMKEAEAVGGSSLYVAPSSISENWSVYQEEYKMNFNGPPEKFKGTPHATVYFEPFSDFFEYNSSSRMGRPLDEVFLQMANQLIRQMSAHYNDEASRQSQLKTLLNSHCDKCRVTSYSCNAVSKSKRSVKSDLSIVHTHTSSRGIVDQWEAVIANIKIKNDFGAGGKNVNRQQAGYYIHFSSAFMKKIGQADLAPMLLLSIVGCSYLQAFAGYRNENNEPCIYPLSQPLTLMYTSATHSANVETVGRFLESVHHLVEELKSYYEKAFPCKHVSQGRWPYFNNLNTLQYIKRICRSVFHALMNGADVIVKFVINEYGEEVHRCLAKNGLAPELLKCESLKCGWKVIIMKYVHSSSDVLSLCQAKRTSMAQEILEVLKSNNYVHGDLRLPNLIFSDSTEKLMVLDFDWAGVEGVVEYPYTLNTQEIIWPNGVSAGKKICREHDEKMILNELQL